MWRVFRTCNRAIEEIPTSGESFFFAILRADEIRRRPQEQRLPCGGVISTTR